MGTTGKIEHDFFANQNARTEKLANIWLDQDPGNDDAIALFMCLQSTEISVKGQTITGGNTHFDWCLKNAKNLLAEWGFRDLPLYRGVEVPLTSWHCSIGEDQNFHGDMGLPKSVQDHFRNSNMNVKDEVGKTLLDLYYGMMALEEKVTYVMTGPASTFSLQIKTFPDVLDKINKVLVMGTSIGIGNITEFAEFNAFCDPEALEILANSDIEKVIYGQEPLDYVSYDQEFINTIKKHGSKNAWIISEFLQQLHDSYKEMSFEDCPVVAYDAAMIPCLVKQNFAKIYPANLKVLKDGEKRGKTCYEFVDTSENNLYKAKWCDLKIWQNMMFECLDKV